MSGSRPSHLPMAAVGLAAAALDVLTKSWAFSWIGMHQEKPILGDFLVFRPLYNSAGPWSWGHGLEWLVWGLPAISVVAVVVIGRFWLQSSAADRVRGLGMALILGGALGNLWDRAFTLLGEFQGVRDFILFPSIVFGSPFPAFNLADTWITIGVVLVGWRMITEKEPAQAPSGASPPADEARA